MDTNDIARLDATEQAALVRRGDLTPLDLVDAAITRIQQLNPTLNAAVYERFDQARQEAADPGSLPRGPLTGVPFLLKDLGQMVEGEPHTIGWSVLKEIDYRAPVTSYVAQKLINSGLIRLGHSAVPELGASAVSVETPAWGQTRNPWDPTRVVGASSGGAAAAVASGMVPIAHGNDAGGSIRIPAAFCGLVGLKPSRGRTSLGPLQGEGLGLSQEEGVLARSVRDAALGIDIVSGNMPGDPFNAPPPARPFSDEVGRDPGTLRVGVVRAAPADMAPFSSDAIAALETGITHLTALGHVVEDSYPDMLNDENIFVPYARTFASHFAAAVEPIEHQLGRPLRPDDFAPFTWALIEQGRTHTATHYIQYADWRNDVSRRSGAWWAQGYDVLILPTVSSVAPRLGEWQIRPGERVDDAVRRTFDFVPFTHIWNATGQPAISLPLHITPEGLPLGVQLVAGYGREDLLLRLASQIESAYPWNVQPLHAAS
ncbi:amidase [Williamsia sp. DF01-3]|uniref:amidase n=1 Tax=Williamsia sp. DF01-3 TaxID=2934157 RepID=UPI001FF495F6|nr:amidase [Williamsia sp. DF01-3]MCK0516279.1 amidase [Williamsia sp. DF01-3]